MTDAPATADRPRRAARAAAIAVVLIAALFALHAGLAARTHSPTYDEPFHALASWLIVNEADFRLTPDHPPYWRYIAGLPLLGFPMSVDLNARRAVALFNVDSFQAWWAVDVMYRVPGNDGVAMIARARLAMTLFPALLALVVARWAWAWAGPIAAVLAAALLSLDPNLLGHGGLVTDDVAATLVFAAAAYLTWRVGTRLDWRSALGLAFVCAIGVGVKMNCLLLAPMVALPLFARALDPAPWPVGHGGRRSLGGRPARVGSTLGVGALIVGVAWAMLWVGYGFRYSPTADGREFNDARIRDVAARHRLYARELAAGHDLTEAEFARELERVTPGLVDRALYAAVDHHLVPHAWGYGLTFARATTQARSSFLAGEYSDVGFASYFPIAFAVKTPLTTLALVVFALGVGAMRIRGVGLGDPSRRWKLVCLLVPPAIYMAVAIDSNINIGLRHALPVVPFAYVGIAITLAGAARLARRDLFTRAIPIVAVLSLAFETVSAFPRYVNFFNLASRIGEGGLGLLGDSNLDWGQDLNALADWHRDWRAANPDEPFYLSYFGSTPPDVYGMGDAINALPGFDYATTRPTADLNGGVYAVSATHLQGIYAPAFRQAMERMRASKPMAILNDTIYIYRMQPTSRPTTRLSTTQPVTWPTTGPTR